MSGFGPVGSAPVASLPSGGNVPNAGNVLIGGYATAWNAAVKVGLSQLTREVLHGGSGRLGLSQVVRETLHGGSGRLGASQVVREVLREPLASYTETPGAAAYEFIGAAGIVGSTPSHVGTEIVKLEIGAHVLARDGLSASDFELGIWLDRAGLYHSKLEIGASIEPPAGVNASMLEIGAWILPPPPSVRRGILLMAGF
jgi:hypothetical protein